MLRYFYTMLYILAAPLLCVRWVYKSFKPPQYREPLRERFGIVAKEAEESIWFHAVSMGESNAAIAIIKKLLAKHPELNIVVTTTTPTGARQIHNGLGDTVKHHYSPCDLPGTIKRFIRRAKPRLLVIMETELWPNWLHHLKEQQIPVILANGRLSERSARKYQKVYSLAEEMMDAFVNVLAVNQHDAERFQRLGLADEKSIVTGNIKFDMDIPHFTDHEYYPDWENIPTWIAASTHKGEDELILRTHRLICKQVPGARLIVVPRHPERFESVARLIEESGFEMARRSHPAGWRQEAQVLLGDTMGELMKAFNISDITWIGGSFAEIGGHNPIEPAVLAKPVLTGPHIFNFNEIFCELIEAGGAQMVENEVELAKVVTGLMQNKSVAISMGGKASRVIEHNRGALDKTVSVIESYL